MKSLSLIAALVGAASIANAASFITPVGVTSPNSTAFYALNNLIQGPGVGYGATEPHDGFGGGPDYAWVTTDPGGYPSDYIAAAGAPILIFDLGADYLLTEISTWGYTTTNDNGVSLFDLRFATAAQGVGNFGSPQTGFTAGKSEVTRDSHPLVPVLARYVEFTAVDNYFVAPGTTGGDRVGLAEVAFVVPEPSATLLGGMALLGLWRRRRS
jgi:hypothetical protein